MGNLHLRFQEFAARVDDICSHISVREDENGPYIFALGLKGIHTLQVRKIGNDYVLELWHGPAEDEDIVAEPHFKNIGEALIKAKEWLQKDAI